MTRSTQTNFTADSFTGKRSEDRPTGNEKRAEPQPEVVTDGPEVTETKEEAPKKEAPKKAQAKKTTKKADKK